MKTFIQFITVGALGENQMEVGPRLILLIGIRTEDSIAPIKQTIQMVNQKTMEAQGQDDAIGFYIG